MAREASNPLANFQFEIIGQVPALLKRFSAPDTVFPTQGTSPSPPPSRSSSPKPPGPNTAPPASRKTLLEALAGIEASMTPSVISHLVEPTSSSTASRLSGASASAAMPNGKMHSPTPVNNTDSTSTTHASEGTSSSAGHIGPASTHPALTTFLPVPSLSISALSSHRSGQTEQTFAQDDAFGVFRNALQRLQAESEEYSRREEETRHAMARQQDQAARWHARADALLEMLTSVFIQCERRVASANYSVSEVERLREVVRRHEEEAAANRSSLARLEAQTSELERELAQRRSQIEDDRSLISSCREELNKVTEQAKTEKAHLLADVKDLNGRMRMQAAQWAKRERELEAELERQKRDAVQEKERLLAQLREHQDAADMDQQRHAAGLELLEEQLRTALETQRRNRDGGARGLQSRAVGPSAERIDGASPTSVIGLPPRPPASSPVSHKMASEAQIPVPSNQLVSAQKSAPYPRCDMEHLPAPHATRELPPRSPATEAPPVKAEHSTPALAQDPAAAKRRPLPAETPTTRRIKPEPSTVGRKPSSAPSASPVGAQPVFQAPVKPETSTPLIGRHVEPNKPPASNTGGVPRREQSLDYEPGPSCSQVKALNQAPVVPGKPVGPSATFAPRPQEFNRPHDPFEAAAIAPETPSPAVSFGMSSSELPVGHPSIPDLAYPSRSNSPALIMSTLPSEDHGVGLGIIDSNQSGPSRNAVGPRSRGHTPPRPVPGQPRGGPRRDRIPVHVAREVDHWSPTPGRPPLYREPYSPPGRLKRPRDEDESPERSPLRARISPPFDGPSRPLQPLPRHSPGARSRSRSPYYNPRGRSPSPRRSPPWDHAYNGPRDDYSPVRPRSYSRSRSRTRSPTPPPPPIQGANNGAPADGYAPPPQADRQDPDVRFSQVVAAPVPEPAPGPLRGAAPAVPSRGRSAQRGMAPAAARAPRAPARRRSSPPVEGAGKVSLLDRLGVGDGDAGAKRSPEKATPNKTARGGAKKQTAKARRGGLASPHAGNQGGSDANSLFNRITAATKPGDLGSRIS
ncbi:hypothetical protein GY45DRAFT_1435260 [Cubamyces sp. BRFM 1775]|nr:hypothetical protein GY45DRAFT_1435260 [Cubamyces sp. BRFM 1775]